MSLVAVSASSAMVEYPTDEKKDRERWTRKVLTLPRIAHPSSRVNDDDQHSLDIRGQSRTGQGNGELIRQESSALSHRRRSVSSRNSSLSSSYSSNVRLPIFGKTKNEDLFFSSAIELKDKAKKVNRPIERWTSTNEYSERKWPRIRTRWEGNFVKSPKGTFLVLLFNISSPRSSASNIKSVLNRSNNWLNVSISNICPRSGLTNISSSLTHWFLFSSLSFEQFSSSLLHDERENSSPTLPRSQRTATQMFFILKEKVRTRFVLFTETTR